MTYTNQDLTALINLVQVELQTCESLLSAVHGQSTDRHKFQKLEEILTTLSRSIKNLAKAQQQQERHHKEFMMSVIDFVKRREFVPGTGDVGLKTVPWMLGKAENKRKDYQKRKNKK